MATAPVEQAGSEDDRPGAGGEAVLCARARWLETEVVPHRHWLRLWIARRYPGEGDVDDIVQESLEKMLRFSDPAGVRDARVYLWRTAVGIVIDRARRRRIVRIDYHDDLSELGLICAYPLPDRVCAAREEWDGVCRALEELPERTRNVIQLRRIEDVPQREVAAAMGLSESAIEKHVRRGLRAVRAEEETGPCS